MERSILLVGLMLLASISAPARGFSKNTGAGVAGATPDDEGSSLSSASLGPGVLIERGEGRLGVFIPKSEVLEYDVKVDIAVLGQTDVGDFVLRAGTQPYRQGLPAPGQVHAADKQVAWIQAIATGGALGYRLEQTIEARLLPQVWPRVVVRNTQRGSESRRWELMYGQRSDKLTAWFREDRHCQTCDRREHFVEGLFSDEHHCDKCKRAEHRVWKKPLTDEIPEGAVDMMTAIHLARTMVRAKQDFVEFPMIDRERMWHVTLTRSVRRKIGTPLGEFWCREIKMTPKIPDEQDQTKFKGLFGIHGTLSFWLDEQTGVPIRIEGIVPLGPFDLGTSLRLKGYSGTPAGFAPLSG